MVRRRLHKRGGVEGDEMRWWSFRRIKRLRFYISENNEEYL